MSFSGKKKRKKKKPTHLFECSRMHNIWHHAWYFSWSMEKRGKHFLLFLLMLLDLL